MSTPETGDRPAAPKAMAAPASRRNFLIIRNRRAGLVNRRLVADVVEALNASGARAAVVETDRIEDLDGALAANADIDAVVAAGGDGTLRALAKAILKAGLPTPVGLIPVGTGNVMAAEFSLPRGALDLARMLLEGPVRTVSVSRANGEPFLAMCGAGFDGAIVRALSHGLKRRIGRAAYVPPTLAALRQRPTSFEVEIDGKRYRASWMVIANARRYGGEFTIAPEASALVAGLHAVLFGATTRAGRVRELLAIAAGRIERCPGVAIIPCRRARIAAPVTLPIEIDGDYIGERPLTVEAATATIAMIMPP